MGIRKDDWPCVQTLLRRTTSEPSSQTHKSLHSMLIPALDTSSLISLYSLSEEATTSSRVVGTNPDIFSTSSLKSLGLVSNSKTIFQSQLVVVTYFRFKRRTILAAFSASTRPLDNTPIVSFVRIAFFITAIDSVMIMNDFRTASTVAALSFLSTASSSFLNHPSRS